MCLPFPGRVIALDRDGAIVSTHGRDRRAMTLVVPDVAVGDWVLVANGTILRRLEPEDAHEISLLVATARGTEVPT